MLDKKNQLFLKEIKQDYTGLINDCIADLKQRLQVYSKDSVYLSTKKIGKNNPKAEETKKDNYARTEWNQTADMALVSGLSQDTVIVRRAGYDNVQEFVSAYNHRLKQNKEYDKALDNWNMKYGRDNKDIKSVLLKLKYLENSQGYKQKR